MLQAASAKAAKSTVTSGKGTVSTDVADYQKKDLQTKATSGKASGKGACLRSGTDPISYLMIASLQADTFTTSSDPQRRGRHTGSRHAWLYADLRWRKA